MEFLKKLTWRRKNTKEVFDKILNPDPCPDCGSSDTVDYEFTFNFQGRIPASLGYKAKGRKCNTCNAKWLRDSDGEMIAYEGKEDRAAWWEVRIKKK